MTGRSESPDPKPETPTLFALHFLGGSSHEWQPLADHLAGRVSLVPIDLPGFGDAADVPGYTVEAMADWVAARIRERPPRRWVLAGHSMGGKVACVVARMSQDGASGLGGLARLILLAGSPPQPEPMDDAKRRTMLGWFNGTAAENRSQAVAYIAGNVGRPLPPSLQDGAAADVLRARRAAWVAWLEGGSREDWSARVGVLDMPALILAGEKDGTLGPDAQAATMAPHFSNARLEVLPEAGHLLPLECPDALAALIVDFLDPRQRGEPGLQPDYRALIGSARVDERTRTVLLDRLEAATAHPEILDDAGMALLRLVVDRVIPQGGETRIDIPSRMVDAMAKAPGDGWRYADLPADVEALHAGLRTVDEAARSLDGGGFAALSLNRRDALLGDLAKGGSGTPPKTPDGQLSPQQMRRWFQDLCATATQIYVAHPATQERLGYSGLANRGDGSGPAGFVQVGLGEREPWEPHAKARAPQ